MTFTDAVKKCFSNYATFSGRARRAEYWWWALFAFVGGIVIGWIPVLDVIFSFGILIPGLAVTARRLHDIGRSGWWLLAPYGTILLAGTMFGLEATILGAASAIAAVVLIVVLFVWTVRPGDHGANAFGPDPLEAEGHPPARQQTDDNDDGDDDNDDDNISASPIPVVRRD